MLCYVILHPWSGWNFIILCMLTMDAKIVKKIPVNESPCEI